jgi:hypothetical protein
MPSLSPLSQRLNPNHLLFLGVSLFLYLFPVFMVTDSTIHYTFKIRRRSLFLLIVSLSRFFIYTLKKRWCSIVRLILINMFQLLSFLNRF